VWSVKKNERKDDRIRIREGECRKKVKKNERNE
jgi:hypothetical protein